MPNFKRGDCLYIETDKIAVTDYISSGQQADVYKVIDVDRREFMAMKHLYGSYTDNKDLFYRKLTILRKSAAPHPALVWPLAVGPLDPKMKSFVYLMELVPGDYKSVGRVMKNPELLTDKQKFQLAYQMTEVFAALHNRKFIYGDISGTNILYRFDVQGNISIKIIDCDNVSLSGQSLGLQGSGLFRAPEVFLGSAPTVSSDTHSLAVAVFRILIGSHPLDGAYSHSRAFTSEWIVECFGRRPRYIFSDTGENGPIRAVYRERYDRLPAKLKVYFDFMFCDSCLHGREQRPGTDMLLESLKG